VTYALPLPLDADETEFRDAARRALANKLEPADVLFLDDGSAALFEAMPRVAVGAAMTAPRGYVGLLRDAICHRASNRFAWLYEVLWRLKHGEPDLLGRASDPAIATLALYVKAVRRDIHKMHAFVRFRKKQTEHGELYFAWFEPDHFILRRATPFFGNRYASMRWTIATPIGTAAWNGREVVYGPPVPKPKSLEDEVLDGLWSTYYRTIFNPARVKTAAMTREMPRRYWKNMPETSLIPELVEGAQKRVAAMDRDADAAPRFAAKARPVVHEAFPAADALSELERQAASCTACPLHRHATQTVFGEGPSDARIVFVGEQPGDMEDLAGRPFVGPAGEVFNRALSDAGIDRNTVYVTNAVKHFKFEPRGKRRLHSKPNAAEVKICHPWLKQELSAIEPKVIVAMGATAALSLMGRSVSVTSGRGKEIDWPSGRRGFITVHPSYLLRLPDEAAKAVEYQKFVADLKLVAQLARVGCDSDGSGSMDATIGR
jgi:probable DNA metabolism protein